MSCPTCRGTRQTCPWPTIRARLRGPGRVAGDRQRLHGRCQHRRGCRGYRWKKAAYSVLDLTATWRHPAWEFTLALDNATNRDYVQGFFWHGEPRTLRAELILRY